MPARNGGSGIQKSMVIRAFDPKMIPDGATLLHIGKRGTGKTTGMMDVIYHKRKTPDAQVFCGTAGSSENYELVIPDTFIHEGFVQPRILQAIQRAKNENHKRKRRRLPKKYSLLVLDDLGFDDSFTRAKCIKEVLMNGRHYGLTTIIALQYALGFKPAFRSQFDFVVLHREIMPSNRKRLYDHFGEMIGTYETFCEVLDRVTENFGALVIHNTGTSTKIEDIFFYWQPKVRNWHENKRQKKWHVGSKAFWGYHFKNYDKHWCDNSDDEPPAKTTRKRTRAKPRVVLAKRR